MAICSKKISKIVQKLELRPVGVPRSSDWGGAKTQITCNDVIKKFQKRNFLCGQRYRRMEDKKAWPGLAHNQDFANERRLELNYK